MKDRFETTRNRLALAIDVEAECAAGMGMHAEAGALRLVSIAVSDDSAPIPIGPCTPRSAYTRLRLQLMSAADEAEMVGARFSPDGEWASRLRRLARTLP